MTCHKVCSLCIVAYLLTQTIPSCICHSNDNDNLIWTRYNETVRLYIHKLFEKYGGLLVANDSITLSIHGFQELLDHLGLGKSSTELENNEISEDHHSEHKHHQEGHNVVHMNGGMNGNHHEVGRHRRAAGHDDHEDHDEHEHEHDHDEDDEHEEDKCYSSVELINKSRLGDNSSISELQFLMLCPILLYQIDSHACCHGNETPVTRPMQSLPMRVWGYALLSVLLLSLIGLASVALVPLMQKIFFNHLLQLLVALAIGSLVGDALLHLLPHALARYQDTGHSHDASHEHDSSSTWCGLVAFAGIYFFFIVERLMAMFANWRRKKLQRRIKRCKEERQIVVKKNNLKPPRSEGRLFSEQKAALRLVTPSDRSVSCEEIMMVVHASKDLKLMAEEAHDDMHPDCEQTSQRGRHHLTNHAMSHGHTHAHTHGATEAGSDGPASVAAVAWMVIMGDGLHNFCDGLAIGAAFVYSVSSGLSTSIAIFCHELPHELGDFAVLLRAGMSVRQAVLYNCVSSVLCFLGLIVGLAVGNIDVASLWIFSLTAGMFLYIALVDMIPEMTAIDAHEGESPLLHFGLQNVGLLSGAAIMLLIALYENEIRV